jgi:hypothetical protein
MRYILSLLAVVFLLSGCSNRVYYAGMEKAGIHKRDIMVSRVEGVKDAQEDAQEEFKSALEKFGSLVHIEDSDLKAAYERFSDEYEDTNSAADALKSRIDKLEDVSLALFNEWEDELNQYKNEKLKAQSKAKLKATLEKYKSMMIAMRVSQKSMDPILATFYDNVLMLKHSLNAQAIGGLKSEFSSLKRNISLLIDKMNKSIKASDEFIKNMD